MFFELLINNHRRIVDHHQPTIMSQKSWYIPLHPLKIAYKNTSFRTAYAAAKPHEFNRDQKSFLRNHNEPFVSIGTGKLRSATVNPVPDFVPLLLRLIIFNLGYFDLNHYGPIFEG